MCSEAAWGEMGIIAEISKLRSRIEIEDEENLVHSQVLRCL